MTSLPHRSVRVSRQATGALLAALAGIGANMSLQAASQTWTGTTDANWATGTNWSGGAAPGATSSTTSDIATFNSAPTNGTSTPILIDAGRRIGGISFSTGAGAFVIGSNGGNALTLSNTGGGSGYGSRSITLTANATNSQIIAAPLAFVAPSSTNGQFGFVNNSATATLSLTGSINNGGTRPTVMVLDGTSTGNNEISGAISASTSGQTNPWLIKRGDGTWTISGANAVSGTPVTNTGGNAGFQILDGLLIAKNNAAFGTSGTANNNQVYVGNKSLTYTVFSTGPVTQTYASVTGGTLEIANGITIDNGVSLNLYNAGTIRGNGTAATNGRINLNTANSTSATLSTVGSGDIFTVGNGGNDLTGGISDTKINVAGPGTIHLGQASNYAGTWSINAGTLRLGNSTALGSLGAVAFGSGSTGKLQLNGTNITLSSVNTNATVGTPVIENGGAATGANTLTVNTNTGTTSTYAGVIQNGSAGTLALTKAGSGSLNLSGANTYSGGTTVSAGTLKVNNSTGSATGSGEVTIGDLSLLGGSGIITGAVRVNSGGIVAPGNSIGDLTVGSLTADNGSKFNFEFSSTPSNDRIFVTNENGLTLNGGGFTLLNVADQTAWTAPGTYNLISYLGSIGGTGTSALAVLNPNASYSYTFGTSSGYVTLEIALTSVVSNWNVDSSGSWTTAGNWSSSIPNGSGESAIFDKELTSQATVALDGAKTLGSITFQSAPNGYAIATGSGGSLTLDAGVSQANVVVNSGDHAISAPSTLNSNTVVSVVSGASLDLSGAISGTGSLTKSGAGSLNLGASNDYSGGTSLSGGVTTIATGAIGSGALSINGATLRYASGNTQDISDRTVTIGSSGATIDTNGNDVALANSIGNSGTGSLTKTGTGKLSLSGANSYSGSTTVNNGTLEIDSNASLGSISSGASLTINGATLLVSDNVSLDNAGANARPVNIGASGATISVATDKSLSVSGRVTGSAALVKNGAGTLVLSADNATAPASLTSAITVNGGTLSAGGAAANGQLGLGTGAITLNDATLALNGAGQASGTYGTLSNALIVPSGKTGSLTLPANVTVSSALTGAGTLNVAVLGSGQNYQGNWSAFTGNINLTGSGQFRIANFQNNVFNNSALNIGSGITVYQTFNPPTGIGTETVQNIGSLSGALGSVLGGNPVAGRFVNWTVGSLNTDTEFAGSIQDTSGGGAAKLTKVGNSTLTLSGNNTYTGATAINAGSLRITGKLGPTAVTIGASGTLAGFGDGLNTGVIGGATTVNGTLRANAAPVNATDRLTFSTSLVLAGNTTFDIDGANYTGVTLSAADSLTYGGSLNINFLSAATPGTYDLFNFTDSNPGAFTAVAVTSIGSLTGGSGVWSGTFGGTIYTFTEATGDFVVSAIPEPSSFAIFAGLVGAASAGLRRRRRA